MGDYQPKTPKDFRNYLFQLWRFLKLPRPTDIQYDIAHFLQHGPEREGVEAFRGVGKSWITSGFVTWELDQDPDQNILVISASKQRADDFSTFTLRLIREFPMLQHLLPRDGQRDSKIAFDVGPATAAHAASVKSAGITGQITGSRADIIILDDVEVPNNSETQAMRDKLAERVKECEAIIKPGGRIIFLGTPQHEQSLYNQLPERGYEIRVWPARYPNEKEEAAYGDKLAPFITRKLRSSGASLVGKPTDPDRFTDLDLTKREVSYGKAGFTLQFQLNTNLTDLERYPLRVRDLLVMDCNPEVAPQKVVWATSPELIINDLNNVAMKGDFFYRPIIPTEIKWIPYQGSVMTIDPAGRGKDETGYSVTKMMNGQIFLTANGGLKGGYTVENLEKLAVIAREQKVNLVRVEPNFGDGMFAALLRPVMAKIYPCTIEDDVRSSSQKEKRICDTLEPVLGQHKLIIDRKVIEKDYTSVNDYPTDTAYQYRLIYQLTRVTREKGCLPKDDRLDSLAMGIAYWSEHMGHDVDKDVQSQKEQAMQDELEKFMNNINGTSPRGNMWFHLGFQ